MPEIMNSYENVILDWGIGGINLLKAVKKRSNQAGILYLSDTGVTPYGKMSALMLKKRIIQIAEWLSTHYGTKQIWIGCNSLSSILGFAPSKTLKVSNGNIEIHGIIYPVIKFVNNIKADSVGVIGGRKTIQSRIYSNNLTGKKAISLETQELSGLIERGKIMTPKYVSLMKQIKSKFTGVDLFIPACTHYELLASDLVKNLPETKLILPCKIAAESFPKMNENNLDDFFVTTGDATAMKKVVNKMYKMDIKPLQVNI